MGASSSAQLRPCQSIKIDKIVHHVACDHNRHVFQDFHDDCLRTEKLLQLRVALVSFFPDGALFLTGKKPRRFAKMLLESWKEHFPDSQETTRSLAMKLSNYDRCLQKKELVTKAGRVNWSQTMIKNVKVTRDEALNKLTMDAMN